MKKLLPLVLAGGLSLASPSFSENNYNIGGFYYAGNYNSPLEQVYFKNYPSNIKSDESVIQDVEKYSIEAYEFGQDCNINTEDDKKFVINYSIIKMRDGKSYLYPGILAMDKDTKVKFDSINISNVNVNELDIAKLLTSLETFYILSNVDVDGIDGVLTKIKK